MGEDSRGLSANATRKPRSVKKPLPARKATKRWMKMEPYGVTLNLDRSRPVMLFKSESGEDILPVWLSPLDAGIAMSQGRPVAYHSSPHEVAHMILNELNMKLVGCYFVELKGHHQFVDLKFEGSKALKTLRVRADQAISLCLHAKADFFSTKEMIRQCQVQDSQFDDGDDEDLDESLLPWDDDETDDPPPYLN